MADWIIFFVLFSGEFQEMRSEIEGDKVSP